MTWLRSSAFLLVLVAAAIFYGSLVVLVGRWLPRDRLLAISRHWSRSMLAALRLFCGLGYRVRGWDELPERPCILMAKHQSAWETIALPGLIRRPQTWVLKQELLRVPFFGWALRRLDPIAIDRRAGHVAMQRLLDAGQQHLMRGDSVLIFPEGTRVPVGRRARFTIGAARLAEKTGAPVVPIAHNAGVFWSRRAVRKLPGQVDVVIGPMIPTEGRPAKDINAQAEAWINATVDALPQSPGR